ncbi:MAG: hypothetical protein [Circular genetic element sp.]|nr:MAG: hypothetical protein [Circular genetic element sp.]
MANHNRSYYREMREKHITRKKRIVDEIYKDSYYPHDGYYSKGKIHCSCPLCREKDCNGRHVKTKQEIKSDYNMKEQLIDFI